MKKFLLFFVGIISLIGLSKVKADTLNFSTFYDNFDEALDTYYNNEGLVDYAISYWEDNYSQDYPYYFLTIDSSARVFVNYSSTNSVEWYFKDLILLNNSSNAPSFVCSDSDGSITCQNNEFGIFMDILNYGNVYLFPLINHGITYKNVRSTWSDATYGGTGTSDFDSILFPSFTSVGYDFTISSFEIEEGDYIPGYLDLFNGIYQINSMASYTEINLNNYSYVALSLKDYTEDEEYYTTMYVKGNYCLTPVYDYGLKERKDVISGTKVQACSPYYDNFTPVRTYILESDLQNHAIYYLKAYDINKENKIKVDSNVFNIHYITSQDEDNPILNINGRNYTTIPYDDLTDSATISEEEGYVSGASCGVGDFNCTIQQNGFNFSDIFTSPLQFFRNLVDSFVSVFTLITSLIAVLPLPMQYFLYLSFTLAIALGIIKIIL